MKTTRFDGPEFAAALRRQADQVGAADISLPTVLADGTRLRRRRRLRTAVSAGAVAASVAVGAAWLPQMVGPGTPEGSLAATQPGTASTGAPFVYATPTTIHLDGVEVALPGKPERMTQVDSGAVLLSEGQVWWVRAEKDAVRLGSYTASDIPGGVRVYGDRTQVGWISVHADRSVVQVVDLTSDELAVVRAELPALAPFPPGGDQTPIPLVLDGDTAYIQDHSGLRAISLSTPDAEPEILSPRDLQARLMDAEAGQLVWAEGFRTRAGTTWRDGKDLGDEMLDAHFSPGARYVVGFASGQHTVVEVATGRELVIEVDAHDDQIGAIAWTDERTVIVQAHPDAPNPWQGQPLGRPVFYSCVVPDEGNTPACSTLPDVHERAEDILAASNVQ